MVSSWRCRNPKRPCLHSKSISYLCFQIVFIRFPRVGKQWQSFIIKLSTWTFWHEKVSFEYCNYFFDCYSCQQATWRSSLTALENQIHSYSDNLSSECIYMTRRGVSWEFFSPRPGFEPGRFGYGTQTKPLGHRPLLLTEFEFIINS